MTKKPDKGRLLDGREIEEEIRVFLSQNTNIRLLGTELANDKSLISSGLIDSLGVLDIIAFLESHFGVEFEPDDLTGDNFENISSMADLIRSQRNRIPS